MAHENDRWTEVLPLILLGIRAAHKEEMKASPAEMAYGKKLTLPSEFFIRTKKDPDSYEDFAQCLRNHVKSFLHQHLK